MQLCSGYNDRTFIQFQTHCVLAGQTAKSRQNHATAVLPEAGKGDAFTCRLQTEGGVQMTRQFIACTPRSLRFMAARKRAECKGLGDNLQTPFWRRVACVSIMIAAYEQHVDVRMLRSEVSEIAIKRCGVAGFRVHQIAKDHQSTYLIRKDQR